MNRPMITAAGVFGFAVSILPTVTAAQTAPNTPPSQNPASPPAPVPATAAPPPPPPTFAEAGPWSFTAYAEADVFGNVAGGQARAIKPLIKTAASAAWDGSAAGHDGWSALASLQYTNGGHISGAAIGDVQGIDNIEAIGALRLYEAWAAHDWQSGWGLKAGFIDLNVDFDTQETAALFLDPSDGVGPELSHSGLNGPSIFPVTALGVTGYWRPRNNVTLRGGIFNGLAGDPATPRAFLAVRLSGNNGIMAITQAEARFDSGLKLEAGAWAYSARFDAIDQLDATGNPLRARRARGAYATVEGPLGAQRDGRGLSGWVRVGLADPVVEPVSGYLGGGVVYTGLLKSRAEDQAGLSLAHAVIDRPRDPFGAVQGKAAETTLEATYRYNARDWLAIQPDAQYIHHPAGDPAIPDAFAIGVRFTITLTRSLLKKAPAKSN